MLLKGSPTERLWVGFYNGIGGHVEEGENIYESAQRELMEGASITDVALRFCGQIMVNVSGDIGVAIFIFRGEYEGEEFVASKEGDLEWIHLADLLIIPLVEDLPVLLPVIAAHHPGDPLIIGKYQYEPSGELKISLL